MNEQKKYEVIKRLAEGKTNKKRASVQLSLSIRHINRLLIKFSESGKSAFMHGNRLRKPAIALDESLSNKIIHLYKHKYQDFNISHFTEMLEENENIKLSYSCVYNLLKTNYIFSPKIRKATKRKLRKELSIKNDSNKDIEFITNNEISLKQAHPRLPKPKYFGEIIEMDGSIHRWFGDKKTCLHLAIDKATNTVIGAYFDYYETLKGYYNVFYQILNNYGIPAKFVTDNRTVFNYNSQKEEYKTSEKDVLTQFGYACKQLGVDIKTTSISQAKGLVERTNGTFQGRLVNELKMLNIHTIDNANKYLIDTFVPKFNKKFSINYTKFESVFLESPTKQEIYYTLAVLTPRKIDNGNAIKFFNNYYQPYDNGKLICFRPKTSCLVIKSFNNKLVVSIDDKIYELRKLNRNEKVSKEFDIQKEEIKKERKKYIPPMSHPWRISNFLKQIDNAHNKKIYV